MYLEHLFRTKYFAAEIRPNSANMVKDVNHVQPPTLVLFCSRLRGGVSISVCRVVPLFEQGSENV